MKFLVRAQETLNGPINSRVFVVEQHTSTKKGAKLDILDDLVPELLKVDVALLSFLRNSFSEKDNLTITKGSFIGTVHESRVL